MTMLDKNDIITLENEQKYVIAEMIDYKNQEYLMLLPLKEDEVLENAKFVKTIKNDKNQDFLVNIEDEKELYEIMDIFIPMFENDYVE